MSSRIRISFASLTSVAVLAFTTAPATLARVTRAAFGAGNAVLATTGGLGEWTRAGNGLGFTNPFGSGSALVGSAAVGMEPTGVAVDPATHTIYVANGNNFSGPVDSNGNTVSVVDSRRCNARDISSCKGPWPTITVGNAPTGIAIDQATHTVYVTNANDNTVSVVNGAVCSALVTSGCGQTPATVTVGTAPLGLYADEAVHTVYIANYVDGTVSMIDSATCSATDSAGCPSGAAQTVSVGGNPGDVDVNPNTHTVYVANLTGLSVLDGSTCNASDQSGCATVGQAPVPQCYTPGCGPFSAKVDTANNTIYESGGTTTVFVFDGSRCNAADLTACATDTPGQVTPFPEPGFESNIWLAVDVQLHTVYVTYHKDDALIAIDANRCNGSDLAGCSTLRPPEIHTGTDPEGLALDPQTQTVYPTNQVSNTISVIDATRCNAYTTAGCRPRVPEVPISSGAIAADPKVATTYVASGTNTVSMIDTSTCNAHNPAGCSSTPATATVGTNPAAVAVDSSTHTVYVADFGVPGASGTVTVLNETRCNSTDQSGCNEIATMNVPGGNPDDIAVNPRTHTVYVATITGTGPDLVSMFDASTCNAAVTAGCDQTPATIAVGHSDLGSSLNLAIDYATNTIYASNVFNLHAPFPPFQGNNVYVINGATCDAANTAGCGQTPASVTIAPDPPIGSNPVGIAVDQATDTVYTANIADGEHPGTVSVINGATCNGQNTSGCNQTPGIASAGFGANGIAVDPATNSVYSTNIEDTSVTTINGNSCNGANQAGCGDTRTRPIVGDYPSPIAIDAAVGTAYVGDIGGVSVIRLDP